MTAETTEESAKEGTSKAVVLTRTHKVLIGVVVVGAVIIASIGFAGSYAAVRDLAHDKGFGAFANVLPIGIDAGIVVLLALDLLLTWLRIPFPLLRQTAWLLTAATIAFNGAAAWPDPLGVGMHAVIPILFVVSVEAARHAIGRIADITADRHMESVRVARWLLAPVPTFRLWRRMKLWELRSYDQVIKLEQDRLVYRARLRARYGRAWRRKAPVESLMPLRLARYGVPLAETAPAGLAAAGLEVPLLLQSEQLRELPQGAEQEPETEPEQVEPEPEHQALEAPRPAPVPAAVEVSPELVEPQIPELTGEQQYTVFRQFIQQYQHFPSAEQLAVHLESTYGHAGQAPADLAAFIERFDEEWAPTPYESPVPAEPHGPQHVHETPAGAAYDHAAAPDPEPFVEPEPASVEELLDEIPQQPEPVPAAPARSSAPARVQAKVEDLVESGEQPVRRGRGGSTRDQVAEIFRNLPEETRALRGRPLAAAIAEASGGTIKVDTVRRTHITEALLAQYLQDGES
ncbi:DUF2637 domain-containing protein [Streptomyces sparsogenes]|uniref:DUF2637 domain-containing protein n=1 Tax=Streptomyces sparsogenes TaxID=67365 RepID=UPI0033CB3DA4